MDEDLLRGFRRGDSAALTRVYYLYVADVERVARGALIRMTFSTANLADVVHEIFLRAFSTNARLSYDGHRDYKPYLLILARNVIINWAKRAGREIPTGDIFELTSDDGASPDEPAFSQAVVSVADQYIESLPAALRAVHNHRFVLAEPQRQAAEALGMSRQNLRTLEKKLVAGLREVLERAGLSAEDERTNGPAPIRTKASG